MNIILDLIYYHCYWSISMHIGKVAVYIRPETTQQLYNVTTAMNASRTFNLKYYVSNSNNKLKNIYILGTYYSPVH